MTFDRRAIFLRAHQLRTWNRGGSSKDKGFGHWLRRAWAEAKAGTLPDFSPAGLRAEAVATASVEIRRIEAGDRFSRADYAHLAALRAELGQLQAAA